MPLHRKRERTRGFNQSKILAKYLARRVDRPWEADATVRIRNTPSQTGLSHHQRRLNVAQCFGIRKPRVIGGRVCLIIDDVLTTGATLNEMATALKAAGAKKVLALTLARVSPRAAIGTVKERGCNHDL